MTKKILSVLLAVFLMVGMTSIMANATPAKQAWVQLPGADSKGDYQALQVTFSEGDAARYYLTSEAGAVISTGADETNYNVKLEYPTGGTPTMSLKGATIINSQWNCITIGRINYGGYADITDFPFILKVETDSSLIAKTKDVEATICGYVAIAGRGQDTLTITGPGKLTCVAESSHTVSNNADLIFKDINIDISSEIPPAWGSRLAVLVNGGNIVLDNTVMNLSTTAGPCMWISDEYTKLESDPYNITVKNGSKLTANNPNSNHPTIGCTGEITFDSSSVEIISKASCFKPKPVLTGVGAVGGTKPTNAKPYNEKKATSYTYFKCGTDIVAETEPVTEATTPATEATTPATQATQATTPATQATTPATKATTPAGTQATKPAGTQATTPATNTNDGEEEGGNNVLLYVVLGVLLAAAIAAAVIVVLMKTKNSAEEVEETEESDTAESEDAAE